MIEVGHFHHKIPYSLLHNFIKSIIFFVKFFLFIYVIEFSNISIKVIIAFMGLDSFYYLNPTVDYISGSASGYCTELPDFQSGLLDTDDFVLATTILKIGLWDRLYIFMYQLMN